MTFAEINGIIPVMNVVVQAKMPYDISYQLYQITKNMDEANDYFIKKYKEIIDSKSETVEQEVNELAETEVQLTTEKFDDKRLIEALKAAGTNLSAVDIRMLSKLVESNDDALTAEPGFTIVS
jgi:hypothetical protein